MSTEEYFAQKRKFQAALYQIQCQKNRLDEQEFSVLNELKNLEEAFQLGTVSTSRLQSNDKPNRKTKQQKHIEDHPEISDWDDAMELLEIDEVGTDRAMQFLGSTHATEETGQNITKKKLRELLNEGILKPGKSHSPRAKHMYCTISLVEFVRLGEETLRNANSQEE